MSMAPIFTTILPFRTMGAKAGPKRSIRAFLPRLRNLTYLGGDRLLTIHCHREGETGLFVRIVDFANDRWKTIEELDIWSKAPSSQVASYKDMAVNLKFGQASLLPMGDDEYLATHWCIEEGQGKILTHRLRVKL